MKKIQFFKSVYVIHFLKNPATCINFVAKRNFLKNKTSTKSVLGSFLPILQLFAFWIVDQAKFPSYSTFRDSSSYNVPTP